MSNTTLCEINENTLIIDLHQLHPINNLNDQDETVTYETCIQVFEEVATELSGSKWNRGKLEDSIASSIYEALQGDDDLCKHIIEEFGPREAMDDYLETLDEEGDELCMFAIESIKYQLANNVMKRTMNEIDMKVWKQVIDAVHQYEQEHDGDQPKFVFKW